MKITSNQANKMIKKLSAEKEYLLSRERDSSTYLHTEGHPADKPDYDYSETAKKLEEIDEKIATLKHAININNITTICPNIGITIDQALVKMAQLNQRKETLDVMRKRIPKKRKEDPYRGTGGLVEYICTNYNNDEVCRDYDKITDQIIELQADIDFCNQTIVFELEWE